MLIKQISIFIENKPGKLSEVADILAMENINIHSLSLADTADFGILRLIVNDPESAMELLKCAGVTVAITQVLAVEVPDEAGGMAGVMKIMDNQHISLEYMYGFVERTRDRAVLIMRFEQPAEAIDILTKNGWNILKAEEVISL